MAGKEHFTPKLNFSAGNGRSQFPKLLIYQITQLPNFLSLASLSFPAQDALVDGFAAFKAFFPAVPELDFFFAIFPAQQDDLIVHGAGEIQQADVEVFYLHADGVNFRQRVFDVLKGLVALGAPARPSGHQQKARRSAISDVSGPAVAFPRIQSRLYRPWRA